MSLRDNTSEAPAKPAQWDGRYEPICKAYGCPLPASIVTDYREHHASGSHRKMPAEGLCSYHYDHDGDTWQRVTRVLRRHRVLLEVLQSLDRMAEVDRRRAELAAVEGDPETAPLEGESAAQWMRRMQSLVKTRVRAAVAKAPADRPRAQERVSVAALSQEIAARTRQG